MTDDMRNHRLFVICVLSLVSSLAVWAQPRYDISERHRFVVWAAAGYSRLNMPASDLKTAGLAGGHIGVGYAFALMPNWYITTGAELSFVGSSSKSMDFIQSRELHDTEGMLFTMNYHFDRYKEFQYAKYVNVPLTVEYSLGKYYFAAGPKVGFHIATSTMNRAKPMTTTGRYEQLIGEFEDMPNHFYTSRNVKNKNKIDLGLDIMASAEAGINLMTDSYHDILRLGVFVDYGLMNLKKPAPVGYQDPDDIEYRENPLDVYLNNHIGNSATRKVTSFMAGVKLTYLIKGMGIRSDYPCFGRHKRLKLRKKVFEQSQSFY
jgi:hypothetical protein